MLYVFHSKDILDQQNKKRSINIPKKKKSPNQAVFYEYSAEKYEADPLVADYLLKK